MKMFLVITAILGMTFNLNANDIMKSQGMINSTPNLEFIENRGQIADQHGNVNHSVLFIADVPYGTVTIRRDGISYSFVKYDEEIMSKKLNQMLSQDFSKKFDEFEFEPIPAEIYRVDMRFNSSNFNPKVEAFEMTDDYNNYYLARCPDGIHYVRKYRTIKLIDVYPDIDFVVYANNDGLVQYDFVVKPGANPNTINFAFEGADDVVITQSGDLRIETPLGRIEQKAPIAYQPNNLANYLNSRDYATIQNIANNTHSQFIKNNDNSISFALSNYNPSKPLIIDPPTRLWGTYYGGGGREIGYSVAIGDDESVYLVGYSNSDNTISTLGTHQVNLGGGNDVFIAKFNNFGERIWGTFFGGGGNDIGYSITCDNLGNIYLTGYTHSTTAIATEGAHKATHGGSSDAFLAKFNSNGIRQWGTYQGHSGQDVGVSVATDGYNNIYIAGIHQEHSTYPPVATLSNYNSNGEMLWSRKIGGSAKGVLGSSVVVDNYGYVYLAGKTSSTKSIATDGAHQYTFGGGESDGFLIKYNNNGVRQWGTFYGGTKDEGINSVTIDNNGVIYIAGYTSSPESMAIGETHQTSYSGGIADAFVAKFSSDGERLWGTYLGGSNEDKAISITADRYGYIYISGWSNSLVGITTDSVSQTEYGGGNYDAFLVKFNNSGERLWGSYLDGNEEDKSWSIAVDSKGYIYLSGTTMSSDRISTEDAYQTGLNGISDAFLVKFKSETTNIRENLDMHNTEVELLISPLPASSEVIVSLFGAEVPKRSNVKLYNQLGNLLLSTNTNENTIRIDTSELPSGTYQLIWSSNGTIISDKLLIVK